LHEHEQEVDMKAQIGDRLAIRGRKIGEHERHATIVEVRGADSGPPYLIHWDDDPHDQPVDHLFFPGSDADVEQPG
jgi:hypothetical protein